MRTPGAWKSRDATARGRSVNKWLPTCYRIAVARWKDAGKELTRSRSVALKRTTVDTLLTHTSRDRPQGMGYKGVWVTRRSNKIDYRYSTLARKQSIAIVMWTCCFILKSWFGHLVKPFLRFDTPKKPLCKEYFLYIGYRVRVKWRFFR